MSHIRRIAARRAFLQFLAASPLALAARPALAQAAAGAAPDSVLNVFEMREFARAAIDPGPWAWLETGADDERTLLANREIFQDLQLRVRRLIDVRDVDTGVELFGRAAPSPIVLAPIGVQSVFHPGSEVATARAAKATGHLMVAATLSSDPYADVAAASGDLKPWFQLYARWPRPVLRDLLDRLEAAGCPAVALTVDTPVGGNRETMARRQAEFAEADFRFGNIAPEHDPVAPPNAGLTWDDVDWLKGATAMKVLIKGIVDAEDARLAVARGVDGLMVSNHGGRQAESGRSALESLAAIAEATQGAVPLLVDGGFRRGTDIFKALALGADAVCVGRPQVWGLGAFGEAGVARVFELLQAELVRAMRFAGVTRIAQISPDTVFPVPGGAFDV